MFAVVISEFYKSAQNLTLRIRTTSRCLLYAALVFGLSLFSHFPSRFLLDDRGAVLTRDHQSLDDSDRETFGFRQTDSPAAEIVRLPVEPGTTHESVAEDVAVQAVYVRNEAAPDVVSNEWRLLSLAGVVDDRSPMERSDLTTEEHAIPSLTPQLRKEQSPHVAFGDITSAGALRPSEITEHMVEYSAETFDIEGGADRSVSGDIPSLAFSDVSFLHASTVVDPCPRTTDTAADDVRAFPPVTTSLTFVSTAEVCETSSPLSTLEPIYAHPAVVGVGPALEPEHPVTSERQQTHGGVERAQFGSVELPSQSVEEIRQPDGTVVRRRVVSTTVRRVATRRVRRRNPDGRLVEYTETFELPEDGDAQLSSLSGFTSDVAGASAQVVGVHTDTEQPGQPQVETDVEVVREALPDGRVVERRIVRTRQRRTVVKRVVVRPDRR